MAARERLPIDVNQDIETLRRYLGTSGHHPEVGEFSEIMAPAKAYNQAMTKARGLAGRVP